MHAITAQGGTALAIEADATNALQVRKMVESCGRIDILVNNAGIIIETSFLKISEAEWDHVLNSDLKSVFLCSQAALTGMVIRGEGAIVNISSDLAYLGRADFASYCAAKAGVIGLTRSLAREFAPAIRINAVAPGPVDTAMLSTASMSAAWIEKEKDIPCRRFAGPEEIARREDRLRAIGEAKAKIEQRAKERHAEEEAEYKAKVAKREEKTRQNGKPPRGKTPVAPVEGARDKDQINLADEESRIMKVSGGGFEPCYNGQLAVGMDSMLIVNTHTVQDCNDKQQIQPALERLAELPGALGKLEHLVADTGYGSDTNVKACVEQDVIPLIAVSREHHHPDPMARFTEPPPLIDNATEMERMRHALLTMAGRALYAQRKSTVEPVIGIIKSVLGFRQFSLRGLENVKGRLNLVAMAWNLKRMFVLAG